MTGYALIIQKCITGMTAVGFEPPWWGLSLMDVRPSLKHLHHSNVLLRLSVSSPYCA
ncbi:unnamed protein product [Staurois parvus]|uniref:Uncharacterized protein n=1 Tax=Staurois parvus TaxID=386267 RepID=A0ABN9EK90_9NEOB|nr:unnamed protein product [Staurois parvus]